MSGRFADFTKVDVLSIALGTCSAAEMRTILKRRSFSQEQDNFKDRYSNSIQNNYKYAHELISVKNTYFYLSGIVLYMYFTGIRFHKYKY